MFRLPENPINTRSTDRQWSNNGERTTETRQRKRSSLNKRKSVIVGKWSNRTQYVVMAGTSTWKVLNVQVTCRSRAVERPPSYLRRVGNACTSFGALPSLLVGRPSCLRTRGHGGRCYGPRFGAQHGSEQPTTERPVTMHAASLSPPRKTLERPIIEYGSTVWNTHEQCIVHKVKNNSE